MNLLIFYLNSILMGIGLAMDAFSISLTNGLNEPQMQGKRMSLIAGCYAFFQFAMPLVGWICVHTITKFFVAFEPLVPWIALFLLLYIGGKMIIETVHGKDEDNKQITLTISVIILQGIATSIDALSVGFTIADYGLSMAFIASLIIDVVTFIICIFGLAIGKKIGAKLSRKAEILGGTILIAIGVEIFVRGLMA